MAFCGLKMDNRVELKKSEILVVIEYDFVGGEGKVLRDCYLKELVRKKI